MVCYTTRRSKHNFEYLSIFIIIYYNLLIVPKTFCALKLYSRDIMRSCCIVKIYVVLQQFSFLKCFSSFYDYTVIIVSVTRLRRNNCPVIHPMRVIRAHFVPFSQAFSSVILRKNFPRC